MNKFVTKDRLDQFIEIYVNSFETFLYEEDTYFLEGMKENNLAQDDLSKYKFWEWTQGVGLYGIWKLYSEAGKEQYLKILERYFDRQLAIGLPAKNINTVTPLLTMSFLAETLKRQEYLTVCETWAEAVMHEFPRTKSGGFQHQTSDSINEGELWDDTLFMTVLFLANMGRILGRQDYLEEAEFQFLLHVQYLTDKKTGLWFHGWTFIGNHNFTEAFWGRGNCWVTAVIPEFFSIAPCSDSVKRYLTEVWRRQVEALCKYQRSDGMWHTLIDDESSYVEASATCGFSYGILKGVEMGLIDVSYREHGLRSLTSIMGYTDEDGTLNQVSYGTPMGRTSQQFYKEIPLKPMPYGQALAILYFNEAIRAINQ